MKPEIFISYTGRELRSKNAAGELYSALEAAGFTALQDKERLVHGDAWHDGLDTMLNQCHGAVILLSPEVANSDWVRREATILSHRKRVCPDFVLLPVLIGGCSEDDFSGLGLDDLKPFQHKTPHDLAKLVAVGTVLAQYRDRFRVFNPEHALQIKIAASLRQSQWECLLALAEQLEVEVGTWAGERYLSGVFARHLAAALPALPLVRVVRAMNHVFTDLGKDKCKEILGLLASAWVSLAAARQLRTADYRGGKCFALNSEDEWTHKMYLRRARGPGEPWKSLTALEVHGGEDEMEMIAAELSQEWNSVISPGSWQRRQQILKDDREPVFAMIKSPAQDSDLQQLLNDLCEGLNILVADRNLSHAVCQASYPTAEFLTPELGADDERVAHESYDRACHDFTQLVENFNADDL